MTAEMHPAEGGPRDVVAPVPPAGHQPTSPGHQARQAVEWLLWHCVELGALAGLAGAELVTGWWPLWIPAGVVAGVWMAHDLQLAHQHRQLRRHIRRDALPDAEQPPDRKPPRWTGLAG